VKKHKLVIAALLGVVLLAAITAYASANPAKKGVSGDVQIVGVWTGDEEKSFNAVLDGFRAKNPDVKVTYKSTGDNTPTVLATAVAGGNPPDLASVSQPGLVTDFQKKGALKNIDFAKATLTANYPADIAKIGVINGHVYGLLIKGANKSTVWYNVSSFKNAGVKRVGTWPQFSKALSTIKASWTAPLSVGGADGWTSAAPRRLDGSRRLAHQGSSCPRTQLSRLDRKAPRSRRRSSSPSRSSRSIGTGVASSRRPW